MKILVCISNVPDTTSKISFSADNKEFISAGLQYIINPYDEIALSKAVELSETHQASITLINVGDASADPIIRKALAVGGAEAIRVNAVPRDAFFVASQIAHVARAGNYNLILTGRESIDYNGSQVAAMLGALLDIPSVSICKSLNIDGTSVVVEREIEGGKEVVQCPMPVILSATEGMAEPRIANMRGIATSRTKPLSVVEPVEVPILGHVTGYDKPAPRGQVNLVPAEQTDQLVELLHSAAKVI